MLVLVVHDRLDYVYFLVEPFFIVLFCLTEDLQDQFSLYAAFYVCRQLYVENGRLGAGLPSGRDDYILVQELLLQFLQFKHLGGRRAL